MSPTLAEATAERDGCAAPYQRHRPEQTLLYPIVEQHYPAFVAHMAEQERPLPDYVQQEFEDYLRCGRLEQGFLRVRCDTCHAEHLVAFSCKRRGYAEHMNMLSQASSSLPWFEYSHDRAIRRSCEYHRSPARP